MWLITTGRRESLRFLSTERRTSPQDPLETAWHTQASGQTAWASSPESEPGDALISAERRQALLSGLAELNPRQRELLVLLVEDPPLSYAEISSRTGIPVGAIGPTRARAVERLRHTAPVQAWMDQPSDTPCESGRRRQA
jgi:RNA polymerase sigma factor (sigma-70 family)